MNLMLMLIGFVLLVVGYAKKNCEVPKFATIKKIIGEISTWL